MTLFSALYRRLIADATVGPLVSTRIFEGYGLNTATPQIQIDVDANEDSAIDLSASVEYTADVKIVTETVEKRESLRRAVNASLNRQSWTDSDIAVSSVLLTSERSYQQSISGDVEKLYYVTDQTYNVLAKEY